MPPQRRDAHRHLHALGDAATVEVRFEYRSLKGLDANERSSEWQTTPWQPPGESRATVVAWGGGGSLRVPCGSEVPVLTMYGEGKQVRL